MAFEALERYRTACFKLQAAILADEATALQIGDHLIDWIADCKGNIPACRETRKAIRRAKRASPSTAWAGCSRMRRRQSPTRSTFR